MPRDRRNALICRYQRCGACLGPYSAIRSRTTVTLSGPLFGPCSGHPSGSFMNRVSSSTLGLRKAVTTSTWMVFQLFRAARPISKRKVVSLLMGAYVSPYSICSYQLITSLALYLVELSGFLLVLNTHCDLIGSFPNCACVGVNVLFRMIELYSSMIAASHFFTCWLSIASF